MKTCVHEFIATGGYTGYFRPASGTWGSGTGLATYLIIGFSIKFSGLPNVYLYTMPLVLAAMWFIPAARSAYRLEIQRNEQDPKCVVIDEMLGMWITLAFQPFAAGIWITGFFLFRIMDILKPYPAYTSQRLPYGYGVILDDIIAGVYANLCLHGILFINSHFQSF